MGSLTPYDLDCNVYLGVGYIRNLYDAHFGETKTYACAQNGAGASYSGWNAVFRYYNGWNSVCTKDGKPVGDPNYVDNVNGAATAVAQLYDKDLVRIYNEPKLVVSVSPTQPREGQKVTITAAPSVAYEKIEMTAFTQPGNTKVQAKTCISPTASCKLEWDAAIGSYSYVAVLLDANNMKLDDAMGTFTVISSTAKTWQVDANFCTNRAEKCADGQGGCADNSGCSGGPQEVKGGSGQTESLSCTDVTSYGINGKICCYTSWTDDPSGCVAKYKASHTPS